jgi:hypothetical protein
VTEYLVELYVPRSDKAHVDLRDGHARLAAEQLAREGTAVRYLRSIFIPADETCFYLYEAASPDAVREAAQRAGLRVERIVEAAQTTTDQRGA